MIMLAASQANALGMLDAGILALLGYGVVFLGLILLMLVVTAVGKAFASSDKKKAARAAENAPVQEATEVPVAPGAAGTLKLHNVEPKTAAMLMAIVADKMGKPVNELRFISIKEVE